MVHYVEENLPRRLYNYRSPWKPSMYVAKRHGVLAGFHNGTSGSTYVPEPFEAIGAKVPGDLLIAC